MIELLAPGGNFEKCKTAFHFGADAVYVGGKALSLRAFADNFEDKEIEELTTYAHSIGKKVYVTMNIFPRNKDFDKIEQELIYLDKIKVDAVIISDAGIIAVRNALGLKVPVHLSTQANTLNKYSAKFWAEQGVSRIILARELSIDEIKEIREFLPKSVELEMFVHGAMCISYSGRCLLSNYLTKRDSNNGECVQACRWDYQLVEKSRKDAPMDIEEDERGTYIMNSKDLKLIENIKEIIDAGVCSLKVEGRMKSEYYVATVIHAYRKAVDCVLSGKQLPTEYIEDLDKAGHRNYTTCYFHGANDDTQNHETSKPEQSFDFIAEVRGYADGFATVIMRNRFYKGDKLEILSVGDSFNKSFEVTEIYDEKGNLIDDAKIVQQTLKVKCPFEVFENDIFRIAKRYKVN
ncbi:MAG: U32 family peptidase [Clostridia bacterium]